MYSRRVACLATCNLNQWAMDFEGNAARIKTSILQAKRAGASYRVGGGLDAADRGLWLGPRCCARVIRGAGVLRRAAAHSLLVPGPSAPLPAACGCMDRLMGTHGGARVPAGGAGAGGARLRVRGPLLRAGYSQPLVGGAGGELHARGRSIVHCSGCKNNWHPSSMPDSPLLGPASWHAWQCARTSWPVAPPRASCVI